MAAAAKFVAEWIQSIIECVLEEITGGKKSSNPSPAMKNS
jgi:hypothetical protein